MLILCGSARPDGDTGEAVERLRAHLPFKTERIDLAAAGILQFDYARPHQEDGFDAVVGRMLAHDSLLFATPVYWYAMGGAMKLLFDRFSDLLGNRDPAGQGRRLAGKSVWMLAVGTDSELPLGFEQPFERTAEWFGMRWRGGCYMPIRDPAAAEPALLNLAKRIAG